MTVLRPLIRSNSLRTYATQVSPSVKLLSLPSQSGKAASISVFFKAGSRFETDDLVSGASSVFKSMMFKSNPKRSALRITRETELMGGVLSTSLGREYLSLNAEFVKGSEAYFTELLSDALNPLLPFHELTEQALPALSSESALLSSSPYLYSLNIAHQLAFRKGLGNSLILSDPHTFEESHGGRGKFDKVTKWGTEAMKGDLVVVGRGVGPEFEGLVAEWFGKSSTGSKASSSSSQYFGGELRLPDSHAAPPSLLLAFPSLAASSPVSPLLPYLFFSAPITSRSSKPTVISNLKVSPFSFPYSDAGLFGVFIEASPSASAQEIKASVNEVVGQLKSLGTSEEAVEKAKAKAKFAAVEAWESGSLGIEGLGSAFLNAGVEPSVNSLVESIDGVKASDVTKFAAEAFKSKPTAVTIGAKIPYSDELSL